MSLDEIQKEIIEEFSVFEQWLDKYEYIIEQAGYVSQIEEKYKTEENLIKGCQSRVWLHAELDANGNVVFTADSDAIITKGLVALLLRVLNNRKPKEIAQADLFFLGEIGLHKHLSPTRSNGLLAMLQKMKKIGADISMQ